MVQEDDVLPRATEPPFLSALHAKNDKTNPFGSKLGESTKKSKTFCPSLGIRCREVAVIAKSKMT